MRAALITTVFFNICAGAFAQESVLDRRLHAAAPAAAVVWAPDGVASDTYAWRVAESAGVPVIFEASPLDYRDPAIAARRFDLDGLTVREALDLLVAQDSRYRWEERGGILVVRPIGAAADPADALNHPITGVRGDRLRLEDVRANANTAVPGAGVAQTLSVAFDAQEFPLDVPGGTVLDLLVAAARAHGRVMWSVPAGTRGPDQAGFSIGFKTFASAGAGTPGSARP